MAYFQINPCQSRLRRVSSLTSRSSWSPEALPMKRTEMKLLLRERAICPGSSNFLVPKARNLMQKPNPSKTFSSHEMFSSSNESTAP